MCEGRVGLIGMRSWGFVWERENDDCLGYKMEGRVGGHCLCELRSYDTFYGWAFAAMQRRRIGATLLSGEKLGWLDLDNMERMRKVVEDMMRKCGRSIMIEGI